MNTKIEIQFLEMGRKDTSPMNNDVAPRVSIMPKPNAIAISFQHKAPIEIISIYILINSISIVYCSDIAIKYSIAYYRLVYIFILCLNLTLHCHI